MAVSVNEKQLQTTQTLVDLYHQKTSYPSVYFESVSRGLLSVRMWVNQRFTRKNSDNYADFVLDDEGKVVHTVNFATYRLVDRNNYLSGPTETI